MRAKHENIKARGHLLVITIVTGHLVSSINRVCFLSIFSGRHLLFHIRGWPRHIFLYDQARETRQKAYQKGKRNSFTNAACRRGVTGGEKSRVFAIPFIAFVLAFWIPHPLFFS